MTNLPPVDDELTMEEKAMIDRLKADYGVIIELDHESEIHGYRTGAGQTGYPDERRTGQRLTWKKHKDMRVGYLARQVLLATAIDGIAKGKSAIFQTNAREYMRMTRGLFYADKPACPMGNIHCFLSAGKEVRFELNVKRPLLWASLKIRKAGDDKPDFRAVMSDQNLIIYRDQLPEAMWQVLLEKVTFDSPREGAEIVFPPGANTPNIQISVQKGCVHAFNPSEYFSWAGYDIDKATKRPVTRCSLENETRLLFHLEPVTYPLAQVEQEVEAIDELVTKYHLNKTE